MPEKDLQRLTSSVDYIDHSQSPRRLLPTRRHYITLVRVGKNAIELMYKLPIAISHS